MEVKPGEVLSCDTMGDVTGLQMMHWEDMMTHTLILMMIDKLRL